MSSSDSSPLSSPPSSEDESLNGFDVAETSDNDTATPSSPADSRPERTKRPPSPPHEYVLADNPDIAFIVMFRSRFSEAFPRSLPHFGPQDIERGIVDSVPGIQVENLLCALLGLVLNRKKFVERGHHQRALEEAIQTYKAQWPRAWGGLNPLAGGRTFSHMSPVERLTLLRALVLWALSSSDAVQSILKEGYKQSRHEDDLNQPLSVQPWGRDGDKRRYWLIEGQDDTHFRLYRESNPALKHNTWRSVAGTIDELRAVAERLKEEGSQAARRLSERIMLAIPRFEATEEKRKRREYRVARREQFKRPEPGFSLYEGRTRGKRMKYTFSDAEDDSSDATSTRRSTRRSGLSTPGEASGPTVTASGRHVRLRFQGEYGESALSGQGHPEAESNGDGIEAGEEHTGLAATAGGPSRRSGLRQGPNGWKKGRHHIEDYNSVDEMEDEEEANSSGEDWVADEEPDDDRMDDDDDDDNAELSHEDTDLDDIGQHSLIVNLRYKQKPAVAQEGANDVANEASPSDRICNGSAKAGGGDSTADTSLRAGDPNPLLQHSSGERFKTEVLQKPQQTSSYDDTTDQQHTSQPLTTIANDITMS